MKVTIVTAVYNGINSIENTIKSVISQDYKDIEYIIIDGGSTDGTIDVIKRYSKWINYWISEKDNGFYDALNKGINHATGVWVGLLNCGDLFHDEHTISALFSRACRDEIGVLYGDSIELSSGKQYYHKSSNAGKDKRTPPDYRHGASFVRTTLHKQFLFDLTKTKEYGYALDYLQICTMYKAGVLFERRDVIVLEYEGDGMSNHILKNKYLRALTENDGKKNIMLVIILIKSVLSAIKNKIYGGKTVYSKK